VDISDILSSFLFYIKDRELYYKAVELVNNNPQIYFISYDNTQYELYY